MNKIFLVILGSFTTMLAGCGSVSPVIKIDADTYLISSHGVVGNGAASAEEVKALESATAYCKKMSLGLKVVSTEKVAPFFGRAPSASVKFRCVSN